MQGEDSTNNQIENTSKEVVRNEHGQVISGSLNPKGRPKKGHSITETIRAMFDEDPKIKRELADVILSMAKAGDIQAIKTLWNYIDGMPKQTIQINDDEDEDTVKDKLKQINDKLVGNS